MAASSWLTQYHSMKSSSDRVVVAIEDVSDLWPTVKDAFEARLPLKKITLNNKARNYVSVEKLPLEFVLTTDPRLRARFPLEQSPFVFRIPYATILLLTCEDVDDYKNILKPRIKMMVQNEDREWFIVFVAKPGAQDPSGKQMKRIYGKLEVDFSSKKRERCCKFDVGSPDVAMWEEIESRIGECIRNSLDRRMQFYEEEAKRLGEKPVKNFCNLFIVKESLAFMFEMVRLHEDALREYDELEQIYLECVNLAHGKNKEFGGVDDGDACASLLEVGKKPFTQFMIDDSFKEFDFRQYIFAHQALLLFNMNRTIDVAGRGLYFVLSFSQLLYSHQRELPFCMREVWVITACLSLIKATSDRFTSKGASPDADREFYRLQAELTSYARTKLMRLGDLVGFGLFLEKSPCNSALLSMSPWPKPSVWPAVPPDAGTRIQAKEQDVQQLLGASIANSSQFHLAPTVLLREANRRRASLSSGSVSELAGSRNSFKESLVAEAPTSPRLSASSPLSRTSSANSRPGSPTPVSPNTFDKPMKLAEVHAAAEHEILKIVTHDRLRLALASIKAFEEYYMELTRNAADCYHRSRKRHGVVLDGELAAVHYRKGNFDTAAKLYEKVCALYSGEHWDGLLAEVLPRLADCQKQLSDNPGFLSSCVKLLSLERGLLRADDRKYWQSELVKIAHSGLKVPVPVDASSLITFCGQPGSPVELCEGDAGTLPVIIWSGFPDDVVLDSLSLSLSPTFASDEAVKGIKCAQSPVLQPGRNTIIMQLQPQRPGSYVLVAFTGQLGQVKLRSHAYCTISAISSRGGSPEYDDYLSIERPLRPLLQVLPPRPLVEMKAAVSSSLLIGEPQWLGLVIRPIDYSLKGAIVHISTTQGLSLHGPPLCQLQLYNKVAWDNKQAGNLKLENGVVPSEGIDILELKDKSIELPDWCSYTVSVMWLQVFAQRNSSRVADAGDEITRNLNIKLQFGLTRNRVYERSIPVAFTEVFHISTRVVAKGSAGTLIVQVILSSKVIAAVKVVDATLALQPGFSQAGNQEAKPDPACLLPISMMGNSESALMFIIRPDLDSGLPDDNGESVLTVLYALSGNRAVGAHSPVSKEADVLTFKASLKLEMPVKNHLVAVGMLPTACSLSRVGQRIVLQWRIERLRKGSTQTSNDGPLSSETEEITYEIKVSPETWMIAGRKKGSVALPTLPGAKATISMACVPLVAGHVHPPSLDLPLVSPAHISHSPPGPHLICIYPPAPSSSFCLTSKNRVVV